MQIVKSDRYKVGVCGIRAILKDKKRAIAFESGEDVKVSKKEYETINKLKWCICLDEIDERNDNLIQEENDGE